MDVMPQMLRVLDEVLSLHGRGLAFTRQTQLLGSLPEFDSMAVVALIAGIEDHFNLAIDDDEIEGETFATVGSLVDFVAAKSQPAAAA